MRTKVTIMLAKMLANEALIKLKAIREDQNDDIREAINASVEGKELQKLCKQTHEIEEKRRKIYSKVKKKFQSSQLNSFYHSNDTGLITTIYRKDEPTKASLATLSLEIMDLINHAGHDAASAIKTVVNKRTANVRIPK